MRLAEVLEETTVPSYSQALISTESRKTCTNLAKSINQTHDKLYETFNNAAESIGLLNQELISQYKSESVLKYLPTLA